MNYKEGVSARPMPRGGEPNAEVLSDNLKVNRGDLHHRGYNMSSGYQTKDNVREIMVQREIFNVDTTR